MPKVSGRKTVEKVLKGPTRTRILSAAAEETSLPDCHDKLAVRQKPLTDPKLFPIRIKNFTSFGFFSFCQNGPEVLCVLYFTWALDCLYSAEERKTT
jgi:hypothetical protein